MESLKEQLIKSLLTTNNFNASLDEVKLVAQKAGIQPDYPIILIGGTNGKGSTCAYLTTILTNAGYKTGTFTSPHVFDYNERIAINNKPVNDQDLTEALELVIEHSHVNLGLFKTFTLASHLIFRKYKIDIAIIEVGIGGLNDATNIFDPDISAITSIGLDHCKILGNTTEEIGLNKAGIFRSNRPAFIAGEITPESVTTYANDIKADLNIFGRHFNFIRHSVSWDFISSEISYYSLPMPSLRGHEQLNNAALSLAILAKLRSRFPVSLSQIKFGLLQTTLIGRFQVLPGTPQIVLDTAHNPQAIEMLLQNMIKLHFAKRTLSVFGIASDKDWQRAVVLTKNHFDKWYLTRLPNDRSCDPTQIKEFIQKQGLKPSQIECYDSIEAAILQAQTELTADDRLVCFGSFLIVEAAYKLLKS